MSGVKSAQQALATILLVAFPALANEGPWDTKFLVGNDRNLQVHCAWNARERATGPYAKADWPHGALATERALRASPSDMQAGCPGGRRHDGATKMLT
jgi:hypothetical protein